MINSNGNAGKITNRALLERNIILLDGDIGGAMVEHMYESLQIMEARGSPEIEIRLFSNGGSVRAGLDIFDALRRYKGKKTGVVYAYARSMAAVILQACDDRVCLEHAKVLIHHVNAQSVSLDVIDNPKLLAKMRKDMAANQQSLYEILSARTKKRETEIRRVCKRDQDMNADEALKFGLIDTIEKGSSSKNK